MKNLIALCAVFAVAAVFAIASTKAEAQGARTVWDGVYTEEQAKRGQKVYTAECGRCHGDNLLGGEAPALTGPLFASNWEGVPLSDLLDRIRVTMPLDNPGMLSRQDVVDIIAHMLKAGTMPAGADALSTDAGVLAQIKFVSTRPQP